MAIADAVNPFLAVPYSLHKGGMDHRQMNTINGKTTVNYATYQCKDGKWLSVAAMEIKFWNNICETIDKPEWKRKMKWNYWFSIFPKAEVEAFFKTRTRDEWIALFKGKDVCIAPILEMEELEKSDYHKERKTFQEFKTSNGEVLKSIKLPFNTLD